jgi:DNA modification methylase
MNSATFAVGDAARLPLADKSVDLVLGSPPYCDCRTYGIDAVYDVPGWIDFMLRCTREALRVCKGLVLWVVASPTREKVYWPAPEGLMHQAWNQGIELWRPCCWHKVDDDGGGTGTPGSGGRQWLRSDWEYVLAFKNPGDLPWAENTAMGAPPKFKPGGAMRNRQKDGSRELQAFKNPQRCNPGNVICARVGGGHMGDAECHENEAPYPEKLCEFFIRSFCPPDGVVCDPFSGSGTTVCEAVRHGRNGIGFDLRDSQIELSKRRLARRIAEGRAVA